MAGRLANITDYEKKKAQNGADALPTNVPQLNQAIAPSSQSVREGFQQMGQLNPQKPVLEKWDLDKMAESQRNNYMQSFDTWAEAEKRGDISQKDWANAKIQEMVAKGENPGNYINMLALMGDSETPEQKAKRERREALGETFRGLGNLIGNVANLYYTHRGGQYIDLNSVNEKHRERMDRIKEKQDALAERQKEILMNARLGDIQAERAEKAAEKKAKADADADALKHKREMAKLAIQNAYKLGQIDAQTAADMLKNADKATKDTELENLRQAGRVALKGMKSGDARAEDEKIRDSARDKDGNIWTRATEMSDNELRQIAQSSPMYDTARFQEKFKHPKTGEIDIRSMASYLMATGKVPSYIYEQMGFKQGKSSKKKGSSLGIGVGNDNKGNKLGIGL